MTVNAKKRKESFAYIGPTIKNKIDEGTIFTNGYPKIAKELVVSQPLIQKLFVPLSEYADKKKEVETKDSVLNVIYNRVKNEGGK